MGDPPAPWTTAPLSFRLAAFLNRHGIRGGYRLLDTAAAMGWLDGLMRYELGNGVSILVPLGRRENRWTQEDVERYEWRPVGLFCERLAALQAPVRLVDCGADIGLFAARVAARVPGLIEVLAFEPNEEAWRVLARNVELLGRPARAERAALGDANGRGVLESVPRDRSAHAQFVVRAPAGGGDFEVRRIDDLALARDTALGLKIDVEGSELDVLRGARETLAQVPHFVIAFEAHQAVCRRTGVDPCEILRWLAELRPIEHIVAERRDLRVDPARAFFEQVDTPAICNLVVWST